jgi:hypothetical protein
VVSVGPKPTEKLQRALVVEAEFHRTNKITLRSERSSVAEKKERIKNSKKGLEERA